MTDNSSIIRAMVEQYSGPAFILDRDYCYLACNEQHRQLMVAIYGSPVEVGMSLLTAMTVAEDRELAVINLDKALAGEKLSREAPSGDPTLERRIFLISHVPLVDGGRVIAVAVTARDVTSEKDHELATSRQVKLFTEALDTSDFAYWAYDGQTGEVFYSRGYYAMLGYDNLAFPMSYEAWVALIHPDDVVETTDAFRKFFQVADADFHLEYRMRTAAGGWRWILGKGRVTEWEPTGLPRRVAGVNLDITQRRLMAQNLTESEARWNSLVNQAPTGILIVGPGGTILFANDAHQKLTGLSAVGQPWRGLVAETEREGLDQAVQEGFRGVSSTLSMRQSDHAGKVVYTENQIGPVRQEGLLTSLVVVSIDVTEKVIYENLLSRAARRRQVLLELYERTDASVEILLDSALDAAVALTDSSIGYIYYYSEETELFTLYSWSKSVMAQCQVTEPQTTYSLGLTGNTALQPRATQARSPRGPAWRPRRHQPTMSAGRQG
jgi:PAS domain S-box-containing protein